MDRGDPEKPKLKIPYYPEEGDTGKYEISSIEEKWLIDYTGLNLFEIWDLDLFLYRTLLRDAVIHHYMKTQEGREYLYNCWRLEQVGPDRERLAERFGKGEIKINEHK